MNRIICSLLVAPALAWSGLGAQTLQLSMEEAIAAALDRNFAIRIERIEPEIADESIRAESGQYDPVLKSEYLYQRDELIGFSRDRESASFSVGIASTLPIGTRIEASVESSDQTTPFDLLTNELGEMAQTSVTSFAGITITQPVLRGFGLDSAHAGVRIARESAGAAWEGFRAQVMDTIEATITAYQSLYFAQQNLKIAERNRDLALQLLKDNKKRVETGALAPLDIVQAESEAALREVSVISARAYLRQAQNGLKALIWDDPASVTGLEIEIIPPDEPAYFQTDPVRDFQLAIENRPEYLISQYGLSIRQLQLRQIKRDALPQLDLIGSYGRRGGLGTPISDSFDDAFDDGQESYTFGAVFSLPFPNRSRSAERTQAYLRRNQAELELRQLEQGIKLELDNASTQLQADWERIQAARRARELAEQSLQAEEKKLRAGTSTTFVVLRLQGDLAVAEIRETNALTDYNVSLARYHRVRGRILDIFNITLKGND